MKERKSKSKTLYLFDLDETLVSHDNEVLKIYVKNKDEKVVRTLTNQEYNYDVLSVGESYDFSDFTSAYLFKESSTPIPKMIQKMKSIHKKNKNVEILTARSDFDDKDLFGYILEEYGIDINQIHVRRAGNIDAKSTSEAKSLFVSSLIGDYGYNKIHLYDDNLQNLTEFLGLKEKYNDVEFHAHHVDIDKNVKIRKII